jgi:hypothetical protein
MRIRSARAIFSPIGYCPLPMFVTICRLMGIIERQEDRP